MNTNTIIASQVSVVGSLLKSKSSSSCSLHRRNSWRGAKHQTAGKGKTLSTGDLRLRPSHRYNLRSKSRSSFKDKEEALNPAGSANEIWDDAHISSSVSERAASSSCKLVKHFRCRSINFNDNKSSNCSQSFHRPADRKAPPNPSLSLASDTTAISKAGKHVHFSSIDNEISYEVTKDDIKSSWFDIDVSSSIESAQNEKQDMTVSFGPTGRFTLSDMDLCKNGKEYMLRIEQRRLINEILGQRTILRQSVLAEQARQKREGVVDPEALHT
eukprot:scaffold27725_cov148-Skeletonema_menzelii.AAC.1